MLTKRISRRSTFVNRVSGGMSGIVLARMVTCALGIPKMSDVGQRLSATLRLAPLGLASWQDLTSWQLSRISSNSTRMRHRSAVLFQREQVSWWRAL